MQQAVTKVQSALDAAIGAAKIIGIIVGLALAWSAVQTTGATNTQRIDRVEREVESFKAEVKSELRSLRDQMQAVSVGVATLVERTKNLNP